MKEKEPSFMNSFFKSAFKPFIRPDDENVSSENKLVKAYIMGFDTQYKSESYFEGISVVELSENKKDL